MQQHTPTGIHARLDSTNNIAQHMLYHVVFDTCCCITPESNVCLLARTRLLEHTSSKQASALGMQGQCFYPWNMGSRSLKATLVGDHL